MSVGGSPDDSEMNGQWHPIFLTSEPSPGVWVMKHGHDVEAFGRIELRRVGDGEARYKVTFHGEVIGWAEALDAACVRLYLASQKWDELVHACGPNGPIPDFPAVLNASWGSARRVADGR